MINEIEHLNERLEKLVTTRYASYKEALLTISKVLATHGLLFNADEVQASEEELIYKIEVEGEEVDFYLYIMVDVEETGHPAGGSVAIEFCQIVDEEELDILINDLDDDDAEVNDSMSVNGVNINHSIQSNYLRRVRRTADH